MSITKDYDYYEMSINYWLPKTSSVEMCALYKDTRRVHGVTDS